MSKLLSCLFDMSFRKWPLGWCDQCTSVADDSVVSLLDLRVTTHVKELFPRISLRQVKHTSISIIISTFLNILVSTNRIQCMKEKVTAGVKLTYEEWAVKECLGFIQLNCFFNNKFQQNCVHSFSTDWNTTQWIQYVNPLCQLSGNYWTTQDSNLHFSTSLSLISCQRRVR